MRRCLLIAAVVAAASAWPAVPAAGAPPAGAAVVVRPRIDSTMPDRFGLDADGDGLLDLPNSAAYVRGGASPGCPACPALFSLRLDGSGSTAMMGAQSLPIVSYRWELTGAARQVVRRGTQPVLDIDLPEGLYRVALEVEAALPWGTARGRFVREVAVEDVLVVAIGDSYASGEGNPERARDASGGPAQWADAPGDPGTEAAHAAAHRSTAAWPALAALALERGDPATSVTFVSVAATGASVTAGLLSPQPGVAAVGQLDQVAAMVGERRIDVLLLSIGGNDIGFARIVRGLVDADRLADPVCYGTDLENIWAASWDGDWNRGSALRPSLPWGVACRATTTTGRALLPGLRGLPGELDRLAAAIEDGLDPVAVYAMEYPDPTGSGSGQEGCGEIVGDVTPPFRFHEINRAEQEQGGTRVVQPLNRAVADAAARHGWILVAGVAEAFAAGHGYCGSIPRYPVAAGGTGRWSGVDGWYRHPAALAGDVAEGPGVSWYRTAAQSVLLQGPDTAWDSTGTLHPNELGQAAMAGALLELLGH
ncbi:MAG: hypothetical protein MUE66_09970 [Acidimicrobiia bacterium]|nr:hypothetical protein [Acidimicrobiia bacterium]